MLEYRVEVETAYFSAFKMNKSPFRELSLMYRVISLVKESLNSGCAVGLSPRYAVAGSAVSASSLARVWMRLAAASKTSLRRGCCNNRLPFAGVKDGVTASTMAEKMPHCSAVRGSLLGSGGSGAGVAWIGRADMVMVMNNRWLWMDGWMDGWS